MEVLMFHLMPWQELPADFEARYASSWITYPNTFFDPEKGHRLYNQYLDQLEYAETLGFDGVCVNEHHQTNYGLMPSPNVMAATLARRTQRLKLAILGNGISLRDHPQRVAEEVAMLDVITGGRIISGFVRGIGAEYHSFSLDPTHSRERFLEAAELIVRAWTEPGPFSFNGKHYRFRHVNVWPKPYQKPHPPVWAPSQGSGETVEWAAEHRYKYVMNFVPVRSLQRVIEDYRRVAAERFGYTAGPELFGWGLPVYVAESDQQARREAREHMLWLFHRGLKMTDEMLTPPGYTTEASMKRYRQTGKLAFNAITYEELLDNVWIVVGSPDTVRRTLLEHAAAMGVSSLVVLLQFGNMPHERALRNMELFGREVLPHLHAAGGGVAAG